MNTIEKRIGGSIIYKKAILRWGIPYALLTFLLHNVFDTVLGNIMYSISFFVLIFGSVYFIARMLYFAVKQQIYNWRYKKNSK